MELFSRRTPVLVRFGSTTAAFASLLLTSSLAQAAPAPSGLSFDVSARLVAIQSGKVSEMPAQTFDARVAIQGKSVRIATEIGDRPLVYLLSPPYLTKLLPESKAGVRWKLSRPANLPGLGGSGIADDLQNLMRNPASLRAALQRGGAKKTAMANLNGTPVEVYAAPNFMNKGQKMTAWLRRSDALPLRVQLVSKTLSSTLSWRNYKRSALPSALFRVPAGYAVRQSPGQPTF